VTPSFIFDTIRDSIVDAFGVAPESVTYETTLAADLGASADRVVRFVFDLARTFNVELIGLADFIFASRGHITKTDSDLARMRGLARPVPGAPRPAHAGPPK